MRKILFTSNFNQLPVAFLIAAVCIVAIEFYGSRQLTKKYFNHEVDRVLHKVETEQFDADYLLLGDSVALQLFRQFAKDPRFAVLATNQAIEVTGQLFITQRYLERNPQPKAVIFSGLPFFYRNLEQVYTENFVLRTFTHVDEIWAIFKVKRDPSIALKMVSYKCFPTYKYRLKLQESLVGFTNANIYSGVDDVLKKTKTGGYSLTKIFRKKIQNQNTSLAHFEKLLDFTDKQKILLYYIPAPIKKPLPEKKSGDFRQHQKLISYQLPPLKVRYPRFYYFSSQVQHERKLFADHVHYTPEGLPHGEQLMRNRINEILQQVENNTFDRPISHPL